MGNKIWLASFIILALALTPTAFAASWDTPSIHLTFDDADRNSSTFYDVANSYDAHLSGNDAPTFSQAGATTATGESIWVNESLQTYLAIDPTGISGTDTTQCAYINQYSDGGKFFYIFNETAGGETHWIDSDFFPTPELYAGFCDDVPCNNGLDRAWNLSFNNDEWAFVCLVRNDTDLVLYSDGVAETEIANNDFGTVGPATIDWSALSIFPFSNVGGTTEYGGYYDEYYFFEGALDQGNITALYNSLQPPTCYDGMSGAGTSGDPCIITNSSQFNAMRDNLTAYYELGNDIDMAGATWDGPVGNWDDAPFTGAFDGKEYTVSNMHWTYTDLTFGNPTAIFGVVEVGGKWLRNVNFDNYSLINTQGSSETCCGGGFIGGDDSSSAWDMSNVHFSNAVVDLRNQQAVGGLVGYFWEGMTISNNSFSGEMRGAADTGGLYGWIGKDSVVEYNFFEGNIYLNGSTGAISRVGGIAGQTQQGGIGAMIFNNSYVDANIVNVTPCATSCEFGGFLGGTFPVASARNFTVENSYFNGTLPTNNGGSVLSGYVMGYMAGSNVCSVSNSYYNSDEGNIVNTTICSPDISGLTTDQFDDEASLTGFDFVTVWAVDYLSTPKFLWQPFTEVPSGPNYANITGCIDLANNTIYTIQNNLSLDASTGSSAGSTYACILGNNVENVTIDGQGYTLTETGGSQGYTLFALFNAKNITIENINTGSEWYSFISSEYGLSGSVDDVTIRNNTGTGIQFDSGITNAVIEDNNMTWAATATYDYSPILRLDAGSGDLVENITVTGNYFANEYATQGGPVLELYSNDFTGGREFAYNFLFDQNTFRQVDGPGAIQTSGSGGNGLVNITFTNNTVYQDAVAPSPYGKYIYNNTILHNTWQLSNGSGFSETCTNDGSGYCEEVYVNALGPSYFDSFWGQSDTNDTQPVALTAAYSYDVFECRDLTMPGVHTITASFSGPGTCLVISSDDVVLNGYGYTVSSNTSGSHAAVSVTGDNVTINGGTYTGTSIAYRGMYGSGDDLTINDAHLDGQYYGFDAIGTINRPMFNNVTAHTFNNGGAVIDISDSVNATIQYSSTTGNGNNGGGVKIYDAQNALIQYNILSTPQGNIDAFTDTNTIVRYNTINAGSQLGIDFLGNSVNSQVYGNNFTGNAAFRVFPVTDVEVYDNYMQTTWGFLSQAGGTAVIYDNVFNITGTIQPQTGIYLNASDVGNTWTNPSNTGFSDTCTNDWSNVCVEDYTVGSSTDFHPVALSTPIPMTVTATAPANNTPMVPATTLDFSVDEYAGASNLCYAEIDGVVPDESDHLGELVGTGIINGLNQVIIAKGSMITKVSSPLYGGNSEYDFDMQVKENGTVIGQCYTPGTSSGSFATHECKVAVVEGNSYTLNWIPNFTPGGYPSGRTYFRWSVAADPLQTYDGTNAVAMDIYYGDAVTVGNNASGSLDVESILTPFIDDGLNHTWSVSCVDDAVPANTGTTETRTMQVRDPWGIYECMTLDTPGTYTLKNNISGDVGGVACLVVSADNVTIDATGFQVDSSVDSLEVDNPGFKLMGGKFLNAFDMNSGNFTLGGDFWVRTKTSSGMAIQAQDVGTTSGITIRDGYIEGGHTGVGFNDAVSNVLFENLQVHTYGSNAGYGILMQNDASNNVVVNNVNFTTTTGSSSALYFGTFGSNLNVSNVIIDSGSGPGTSSGLVLNSATNVLLHDSFISRDEGIVAVGGSSVVAYNNTFTSAVKIFVNSGSQIIAYDNLINSSTPVIDGGVVLNQSTVGNTWTNPAQTGFSDTCINDWYNVCVEDYVIGSSTDYSPVALSTPVPMTVTSTAPANDTGMLPTDTFDFSVDEYAGASNFCYVTIDSTPYTEYNDTVASNTSGSIDASSELAGYVEDGDHTWSVYCEDESASANNGSTETRTMNVLDPWGVYACGSLSVAGTYTMKNDIVGGNGCLSVDGNYITLNAYGFTVSATNRALQIKGDHVIVNGGNYTGGTWPVYMSDFSTTGYNKTLNDVDVNGVVRITGDWAAEYVNYYNFTISNSEISTVAVERNVTGLVLQNNEISGVTGTSPIMDSTFTENTFSGSVAFNALSDALVYDNVFNTSAVLSFPATIDLNQSTTGNTWTNSSATGHSDTCTNDGYAICEENYVVGSATDYAPVALSATVPAVVTVIYPADSQEVTDVTVDFNFTVAGGYSATYDCSVYVDDVYYGDVVGVAEDTSFTADLTAVISPFHNDALTHNVSANCTGADPGDNSNQDTHDFTVYDWNLQPATLGAVSCPSEFPNEDNLPSQAQFAFEFNVWSGPGFTTPTIDLTAEQGVYSSVVDESDCGYVEHNSRNRTYTCNVSMDYWFSPGAYDVNTTFTEGGDSDNQVSGAICTYGTLIASKRTVDTITFPGAAPGVNDVVGTPAMNIRNTGNIDLDLAMTAKTLTGRTDPGETLNANNFKAGDVLGSAVTMENNVNKDLSMELTAASGAEDDIFIWLSMPLANTAQEYFSPSSWELHATG